MARFAHHRRNRRGDRDLAAWSGATSVLVLPRPERESDELRRIRSRLDTDAVAMRVTRDSGRARGCHVEDVSARNLGYDITSLDTRSGEMRLIEVKGLAAATGTIPWSPNEKRVAEDRRDCYWLYVVTNCGTEPVLQKPIPDPARFPWQEVSKVQYHYLNMDAMTQPMQVREDEFPCEGER